MKSNLYYVAILASTLLILSGPASFATSTGQTQLTDDTTGTDDDLGVVAVSIGEGSNATVQHYTFTPQTIEINAGETVTWFSPDEFVDIHTVTFVRDPSIQSDILLPFAIPAPDESAATNFELLPPFNLGEPLIIPGPEGRQAIVALNKLAWYPAVVDANNQATYLEGADIQATLNSSVKVLNSGIILPPMPTMDVGQVNNTESGTTAVQPQQAPEISPTSLTTETTNATGTPTDVLTVPDDEGIPQGQQGATEEPLGPPFPPVSSFTVAFEEPGVYPYFCAIHPWMSGQVIVQGDIPSQQGTQPLANDTATATTTSPDATSAETQSPAAEAQSGPQPLANDTATATTTSPDATSAETQDVTTSGSDADRPTPPSTGSESPNPIFG